MISQNCPVCHSSRIRRGYKHTYFWSKLVFRYNLLCDNCNWEFVGFALPLGEDSKSKKRKKTNSESEGDSNIASNGNQINNEIPIASQQSNETQKKVKKRIRVKT